MTLVIAVTSPETIWLAADRRLSFSDRGPRDDAVKVLDLKTMDGHAMVSYAGLGLTVGGTEPSAWMSSVLRGRDLPLEGCLGALAEAIYERVPPHLETIPHQGLLAHHVMAAAFVDQQPRIYTIKYEKDAGSGEFGFECQRWLDPRAGSRNVAPRVAVAGSGALVLSGSTSWARDLMRTVKEFNCKRLSGDGAAAVFAGVMRSVAHRDPTVSEACGVFWRYRNGGGEQRWFPDPNHVVGPVNYFIPSIHRGSDTLALVQVLLPYSTALFDGLPSPAVEAQWSREIEDGLARLPTTPDDRLD
jgi:hypothetical protein